MNEKLLKLVPEFLKPLAREVKFRYMADPAQDVLRKEQDNLQSQWKQIVENSKELIAKQLENQDNQHILFFTGYGVGTHYLAIEPILMMSLFMRGCKISSLYCNASLSACEFNSSGNNIPAAGNLQKGITQEAILSYCNRCSSNIYSTYDLLPVDLHSYDSVLDDEDFQIASEVTGKVRFEDFRQFEHEGVKVGEEVFASVLRATLMGTVEDTQRNRQLVKRYLIAGVMISRAAEKTFRKVKPDKVMLIHGVYLTHGIPVKVADKLGIPVIVVGGGGIRKDTAVLCHGETYHKQLVNESNSLWENNQLSEEEKNTVINYSLQKRTAGGGVDYLNYHPNPIEDEEFFYKELNLDPAKPIISAFTNVIWDAQIFYSGNAFSDIFEWIFTSIEEMGKNKEINFVIRIHPAEVKGGNPTKQPMLAEIEKRFPQLPDNVRIIPPESDISSYTLAEKSKIALIYGTKMGLEIALMKTPLVICGETFSRGKGYGLDITSKDQYLDLIRNIHHYETDRDAAFERALQYANYFYFRKMIKLPFTTKATGIAGAGKSIDLYSFSDLEVGKDEGIDTICEGVLNLTPFHLKASAYMEIKLEC
jgi:hypothetical protein